ncbi:hypothetical protein [Persicirhabdus sediminis]|uniref:Uncharacterized protein n=1 Tax=Persicirhabdus sediminis TaxID=454144 RepID=A0A8J7MD83_9BACT|nr:hypothetical protein [Persicirhabdus sediminis]MBK1790471.1 hypothetical protein [Persicirhabdus sediminis]
MSHHHSQDPPGKIAGPGFLFGLVGMLLASGLHLLGLFGRLNSQLDEVFATGPLGQIDLQRLPVSVEMMVASVLAMGLSYAVLDSARAWRRVLLGITLIILIGTMVPVFALWGILYSPFLTLTAVLWSWFCSKMYTMYHIMPCEIRYLKTHQPRDADEEKIVELMQSVEKKKPAAAVEQIYQAKEAPAKSDEVAAEDDIVVSGDGRLEVINHTDDLEVHSQIELADQSAEEAREPAELAAVVDEPVAPANKPSQPEINPSLESDLSADESEDKYKPKL